MRNWLAVAACLAPGTLRPEPPFALGREDLVAIQADTAWEDLAPDTVHFSGHFEMRVRDWRLTADRATVQGRLEDPRSVALEGSPARFDLVRAGLDGPESVQAEAERIVYDREADLVSLEGNALVSQGDSILRSDRIEYRPGTDRLRSTGRTGVRIDVRGD